ncbi:hypothetical protein GCM10022420_027680 [Streptomyces iranensis]
MRLPKGFRQISVRLMKPMTEQEIRAAFVNCTKGEAKRLSIPRDLADRPWDDLDYLGWRDPQAPDAPTWSPCWTAARPPWRCAARGPPPGRRGAVCARCA